MYIYYMKTETDENFLYYEYKLNISGQYLPPPSQYEEVNKQN